MTATTNRCSPLELDDPLRNIPAHLHKRFLARPPPDAARSAALPSKSSPLSASERASRAERREDLNAWRGITANGGNPRDARPAVMLQSAPTVPQHAHHPSLQSMGEALMEQLRDTLLPASEKRGALPVLRDGGKKTKDCRFE